MTYLSDVLDKIKRQIDDYSSSEYFRARADLLKHDLSGLKKIKIAVLRSYSCESIETYLFLRLVLMGV